MLAFAYGEVVCEGAACEEHASATEAQAVNDMVRVEVSVDLTSSHCDVVTASGGELRRWLGVVVVVVVVDVRLLAAIEVVLGAACVWQDGVLDVIFILTPGIGCSACFMRRREVERGL
jgi:hypothetical protein